jgi:integrase
MARKTLTDKGIAALKPRAARYAHPDPELSGLYVRVQPTGAKTFWCIARNPDGKQIWTLVGDCAVMSIEEARNRARDILQRVRDGLPAVEPKGETFEAVARQWLARYVSKKRLRSEPEITRLLKVHVFPRWQNRPFLDIRRSDVAKLLDQVEDDHGGRQADYVLAIARQIMGWYAARHDTYAPPIVKGMQRTSAKQRERSRILDDKEIREIWRAAGASGAFGALVRLLLLTGQRREKVVSMRWGDVSIDGEWTIPTVEREKGNAGFLVLPPLALKVIQAMPQLGDNPYVVAGRGDGPINGFSKSKRRFDAALPKMPQWQLHDLRRTARSLMSRAGVRPDIGERVLGHAIEGVKGIYDRFEYTAEKTDALARLASLIDGIVHPRGDKVVEMRKRAKRQG